MDKILNYIADIDIVEFVIAGFAVIGIACLMLDVSRANN